MDQFPTPPAPGRTDAQELLAHIRQLEAEPNKPVSRQHVVSQVLLRRFAAPGRGSTGNLVSWLDLHHPERHCKDKGTKALGFETDFVAFASGSLEELWNATEQRMGAAFAVLDDPAALGDREIAGTLRDTVALHFIRSLRFREVHNKAWKETYDAGLRRLLGEDRSRLDAAAVAEFGIYPGTQAAAEYFAQRFMETSQHLVDSGAVLRTAIEERFHRAREILAPHSVNVLVPAEGEFLIGDSPAITFAYTNVPTQGVFGVPLGNAHTAVLPVGPQHLIAIGGPTSEVRRIPRDEVDALNTVQIQAAVRHVYFRPGSSLPRFVRTVCASGKRQPLPQVPPQR
ncbi:DUF4238 domain-containing protein (plasmid) [Kitasatospora griseola]|uniref:DUF4238 domain-containing protein n=1 Tax=Kitasatospora griseola TaxID=2064 RepID=UPI003856073C